MNVLVWHVHGSWMTAFVHGHHRYLVPVLPDRGPDGRGRAQTYEWPTSAVEITPEDLSDEPVDVVVVQRPRDLQLARRWLRREPGRDLPVIYVEHNTPPEPSGAEQHPAAAIPDCLLVHVTAFNAAFWRADDVPTVVIDHGIVDPGYRYLGDRASAAVVINEPVRRSRATGSDLLPFFAATVPLSLYGMATESLGGVDLPQDRLHAELVHDRVYLHPNRWTSLGLSLLEAMHLGMPVVALATTETVTAVPREAGVIDTNVTRLREALTALTNDPDRCTAMGLAARAYARERFGLARFLEDWDDVLTEAAA